MKKLISLLCATVMTISLAGCGSKAQGQDAEAGDKAASTQPANAVELTEGKIEGEITVSCYETAVYKDFLDMAATAFEQEYPGTKINVKASSQMPDLKSSESDGEKRVVMEQGSDEQGQLDYINKINTELMGGSGADVLAMDIIPFYKYVNNGQLEDIRKYMEADENFNINDYRKNIFDALIYKGGQYIFPLDYTFNYYEYDSSLFSEAEQGLLQQTDRYTIEQLVEIGTQPFLNANSSDSIKMLGIKANSDDEINIFKGLLSENYNHFIDLENKKANFTDGTFAQLLDTVKNYQDSGYVLPASQSGGASIEDFEQNLDARYFYKLKGNISLLLSYLRKDGLEIAMPLAGVHYGNEKNDKIAGIEAGVNGQVRFSYSQAFGINANSTNKALAWEFIKFMASREIQESMQLYVGSITGLPINNAARMSKAEDGITLSLFMPEEETLKNAEMTASQKEDYEQYVETVEKYSDMLNTYLIQDNTVNTIINSAVKSFFDGTKSSEDTAKAIQSKVEMYLNE